MCSGNNTFLGNSLRSTFGGTPRDHLLNLHNRLTPIGLPNPTHLDFAKKKAVKPSSPFGGYVSAYDQRTALGG